MNNAPTNHAKRLGSPPDRWDPGPGDGAGVLLQARRSPPQSRGLPSKADTLYESNCGMAPDKLLYEKSMMFSVCTVCSWVGIGPESSL